MPLYRIQVDHEEPERQGILTRIAVGVLSLLALIVSAFLGAVIFLAVLGFMAVAGAVLAVRIWLFKRRVDKSMSEGAPADSRPKDYIDVEYREVESERQEEDGRPYTKH